MYTIYIYMRDIDIVQYPIIPNMFYISHIMYHKSYIAYHISQIILHHTCIKIIYVQIIEYHVSYVIHHRSLISGHVTLQIAHGAPHVVQPPGSESHANGFSSESISLGSFPLISKRTYQTPTWKDKPRAKSFLRVPRGRGENHQFKDGNSTLVQEISKVSNICQSKCAKYCAEVQTVNSASFTRALSPMLANNPSISLGASGNLHLRMSSCSSSSWLY